MSDFASYALTDGKEPMSYAEIDCLKDLAQWLPTNPVIINIGAATGVSTCAFLEERPDATVYSIDVLDCPEEFANVERCGLDRSRVHRVKGDSKIIGRIWMGMCDLLYVDGNHWDARADIEAWVETGKVKPGGVIGFHDFMETPPPENPGSVWEHVTEKMAGYEQIVRVERVIAFRMP